MFQINKNKMFTILLPGIIGAVGALLILIADIVYNLGDGNRLGSSLYITTYFGVFLFPLWWAGIFVIYQGLKPAGFFWSFVPCILLAFNESTINVFMHSSFPYRAIISDALNPDNNIIIREAAQKMILLTNQYTGFINYLSNSVELTLSLWIALPILIGKTYFPRWTALLIPIFPLIVSLIINLFYNGFFALVEPYLGSSFMVIIFIVCTIILYSKKVA